MEQNEKKIMFLQLFSEAKSLVLKSTNEEIKSCLSNGTTFPLLVLINDFGILNEILFTIVQFRKDQFMLYFSGSLTYESFINNITALDILYTSVKFYLRHCLEV